ncbi:MAG TPA: ABC transporter ATP-binding protein, partial [bacterium]|nr:ABC transporter ATP-binding protein [bacterium]
MAIALQVSNLTKIYKVYKHRQLLAAQPLQLLRRSADGHLLYALNDVSFEIEKGEIFGIIGHNGSGKSTLLKILSGITTQNSGSFSAEGRITSLLELGVGFEPEMTGRENIYLYGSLIGLDRTTIEAREHEIIEFSGIERFIDAPVKSYSSGMLIRLAFATAIHTQPDILLLDEVLGVGDDEFRHRSFQAIQKAVERGVTVVIVSHGLTFVGNFCSRVMCLNQGEVAAIGPAEHVIQTYMDMISARDMICEIGCDSTRLRFMPGGFHIEHAQKVYTVVRGCSVNLRKWEADFLSSEASFEVLDLKPDKVRLKLSWGHWNLEQLWTLRLDDPRTIRWEIENGPNLHENVDSFEIEIMVSGVFRTYILPEEFREFPETINRGFNME